MILGNIQKGVSIYERPMNQDIETLESTTFGGKRFTRKQLAHIQETVETFPALSRRELGHTICENLRWTTPKGVHRIQACLGALAEMEAIGIIKLPAKEKQKKHTQKPIPWTDSTREQPRIAGPLDQLTPIGVQPVTEKEEIALWNEFVDRYHYLGYKRPIGAHMRYFIVAKDHRLLGCLSFSFAVRALACREQWIGWDVKARSRHLHLIVNNNRFLIFPWVEVKCLASKVLSTVSRQIGDDWQAHHGYRPVLLETFVDPKRFKGTSYQAANWQAIGKTDRSAQRADKVGTAPKDCYVYPLDKHFRAILKSEKNSHACEQKRTRKSRGEGKAAHIRRSFHPVVAKDHRARDRCGQRLRSKVAQAPTSDRYAVADLVYLSAGFLKEQTRLRDHPY